MKTATLLLLVILFSACSSDPEPKEVKDWNNEESTKLNKELAIQEDIDIKLFLARHEDWKAEETGSGLRYIILEPSEGEKALSGKEAKVSYKASLLDGTLIYETPKDQVDVFRIDQSDIESGIQEGIKKMRVGETAKLIIPSHLAHGLVGDLDKIPPLVTFIIDIKLLEVK